MQRPLPALRQLAACFGQDERRGIALTTVFVQRADCVLAMRWRHDSIVKGLEARPELGSPAVLAALQLLNDIIEQRAPRFQRQLPDDTLLWADNHRTLHGRARYSDPDRHLIRIRISNTPNADRIGPSGIAAD